MGVRSEYRSTFGREHLTVWEGPFASEFVADAWELPGHDGYMVDVLYGPKVRVSTETPRTDENFMRVDAAILSAILSARAGRE